MPPHYTGNDICHLEEVAEGLFDCWCREECCQTADGKNCICPDCWCQLPAEEIDRKLGFR